MYESARVRLGVTLRGRPVLDVVLKRLVHVGKAPAGEPPSAIQWS